jgi:hypothetical protein
MITFNVSRVAFARMRELAEAYHASHVAWQTAVSAAAAAPPGRYSDVAAEATRHRRNREIAACALGELVARHL